jgi:hypothetical protein
MAVWEIDGGRRYRMVQVRFYIKKHRLKEC